MPPVLHSVLVAGTMHDDWEVRWAAVLTLEESGLRDSMTIRALIGRLADPYDPVQTSARRALRSIGERVLEYLPSQSDATVESSAHRSAAGAVACIAQARRVRL